MQPTLYSGSAYLGINDVDSRTCDTGGDFNINIPIYQISYCTRIGIEKLEKNPICCLHPYNQYKKGFKEKCCELGVFIFSCES